MDTPNPHTPKLRPGEATLIAACARPDLDVRRAFLGSYRRRELDHVAALLGHRYPARWPIATVVDAIAPFCVGSPELVPDDIARSLLDADAVEHAGVRLLPVDGFEAMMLRTALSEAEARYRRAATIARESDLPNKDSVEKSMLFFADANAALLRRVPS